MKRRTLISLGLGSFVWAATGRRLAAQEASALRFAVIGDVGTGEAGQYAVAKAMARRWQSSSFPFVLTTGDNIYPNGDINRISDVFEQPYEPLLARGVKFYATLGNHDFQTNRGSDEMAYPGYNMSDRHYTFRDGPVQFFALDTNLAYLGGEQGEQLWQNQLSWLRSVLGRSRSSWKIAYAHHTIYSSGQHSSSDRLIADLSPIFSEYGVQLYINGHDHNYERTNPINGTTYMTSGNGAKLRPVGSSAWTAHASAQLGFSTFGVYPDRLVINAVNTDNEVYDEATVWVWLKRVTAAYLALWPVERN